MSIKPLRVGVIGSGIISDIYLKNMIERFDILEVKAVCSAHLENARRKAGQYGIEARTYEEILADPDIDMVVNLTPAPAHEALIRAALEAGKHVYTEKTMTLSHETARSLAELAAKKGIWLGSAPDTFLGAALQTARAAIDEGLIGEINSFALASNRDNSLINAFFRFTNLPGGGVGYDYSVYYLTALVSLLGPVAQVAATVRAPYPTHIDKNPAYETFGKPFPTPNESEICGVLKLRSGVCGTIHFNNDSAMDEQAFFALYGTKGILYLPNPDTFGGEVRLLRAGATLEARHPIEVVPHRFGFAANSRGVGPAEMAWSIRAGRPCRANARMACHVLEVVDAVMASGRTSAFVDVRSDCERPAPLSAFEGDEERTLM